MIYPSDFESKIGFDYLRVCVSDKCQSAMGKEEVAKMSFSSDFNFIKKELDMRRMKQDAVSAVTIYRDFETDGKKMRGSAKGKKRIKCR